MGLIGQHPVG